MITQERLRELVSYDPEMGNLIWKIDIGKARVGAHVGCKRPDGYMATHYGGKNYRVHRLVWLYHYGELPTLHIDHIDGDRSNNRLANLRLATRSQNMFNRGATRRNKTGLKGVTVHMQRPGYFARIQRDGKVKHLGYFLTAEEAHEAYCKAAREIHGDFAKTA